MELRVLNYFLAICREGSITRAAESLHVSQPTLSRQIKDLEDDLGKPLFIRGNRSIKLTEEGILLKKRASEMMELARRTREEILVSDDNISGDIYIDAGETQLIHFLTSSMASFHERNSNVRFHISSGDTQDVYDVLDKGLADFGVVFYFSDEDKYESLKLPGADSWGIYMKAGDPLAEKNFLSKEEAFNLPLIIPRRSYREIQSERRLKNLNITGTYSLMFNAVMMVKDGLGYALGLEGLADTSENSGLSFLPVSDLKKAPVYLIWKKYITFSRAAGAYLKYITSEFQQE